jgi:hypothetical protein
MESLTQEPQDIVLDEDLIDFTEEQEAPEETK